MDHGELSIRKAFTPPREILILTTALKLLGDLSAWRLMASDYGPHALASEKLNAKLLGDLRRRRKLLKHKRWQEGLCTPDGRQVVFFVLSYLRFAEKQGLPAVLQALLALLALS